MERQTIVVRADGSVALPDLTDELANVAAALGGEAAERIAGQLGGPRFSVARGIVLPVGELAALDEGELWRWHERGAIAYRREEKGSEEKGSGPFFRGYASAVSAGTPGRKKGPDPFSSFPPTATWLSIKQTLAHRLLAHPCRLCARRCPVDRAAGQTGFCGLGTGLRLTAPVRLWGEEPELGRPGLGLMTAGCGLRCRFCYRPDNLSAHAGDQVDPRTVADWIDAAEDVEHVHFLGGNPDESLPAILDALALVTVDRPIAWNTHSHLTPEQLSLLEGVVDGFVADLKFGPGECAERIAGIRDYWSTATAAIQQMASFDSTLLIRHVALPGHHDCCTVPVARWLKTAVPEATVRLLDQYEPLHRAEGDPALGRRLSDREQAKLADLANWLGGKDGKHG